MPDDPDRIHDTDPLADTQAPDDPGASASASASASQSSKRRSVHVGDTLGRYELVEDVGEGGMATVYRARDKELRREVALKVLFPHLARRDEVVRRFHREARAAAGLEHANILRVYDVGGAVETDDPPYIVMELIRGRSLLGEIEQGGPMLAEVAACIGALLADALAVAHKAGIIHRDIKPANVMIAPGGRVLLADFGVARLETEDSLVTKTGALLGTPAYMSPEQASGDTATARSDLYSLGATLYQLATGQLPYTGSPAKVLAQIAQGAYVSAVRKRTEVGPDLSRVIDRLMAVEPAARPASALEVADELRNVIAAGGLGDPADELAAYFADPAVFLQQKTPLVVGSLVKAGEVAIREGKLPRAIALADRASALAPDDPAVAQLVATVTEGGRASKRRRIAALAGIAVVVVGGATFGAVQLLGGGTPHAAVADAAIAQVAGDAASPDDAAALAATPDHAALVAMVTDAGVPTRVRDAGVASMRRADASTLVAVAIDAGVVDAAPQVAVVPADAAVAATGFIVVKNDAWCDVTIDGVPHGRASTKPISVSAGPHSVVCAQPTTGKSWTKQVTVAPAGTAVAEDSMANLVNITLEVDATIDGTDYKRGQVARLKAPNRVPLVVGGTRTWLDVRGPCRVRSTPEIGCY